MLREQVVVAPKTSVIFGDAHEPPRPQCFSGAGAVKSHRGRCWVGKLGLAEGAVPSFDGCRASKASALGLWRDNGKWIERILLLVSCEKKIE